MANMNFGTPKLFPDVIAYHRGRGSTIGTVTATGGSGATATRGLQSGTAHELFDLRPLNTVSFDTGGDTDSQVLINVALSSASFKTNYIAILNHNLASASGKIRIFAGNESSDVASVDGSAADTADINWSSVTVGNVINADTLTVGGSNKSMVIQPNADGTTIISITEQGLRYWGIQFEGATGGSGNDTDETWGSTDLILGGIMMGESFEMPHNPDLSATRSIMYDQVKVQESSGGQRYGIATNIGRSLGSPFSLANTNQNNHGGRIAYDLNFSYVNSTDLMPDEYGTLDTDDDQVIGDVWNITDGPTRPFIFTIDKDSTGSNAESEYIFARFAQNSFDMEAVAVNTFNVGMRIEEEF